MPRAETLAFCAAVFAAPLALAAQSTPVGTWRTFNDAGHETGAVTIVEDGGVLSGRVSGILDPARAAALCQHCPDDRRDQKVLGLQIIRGVRQDGALWDGGEILDPETGRLYRVSMRVEDDGRTLVLRGYIGISLFGRSQRWTRSGP